MYWVDMWRGWRLVCLGMALIVAYQGMVTVG